MTELSEKNSGVVTNDWAQLMLIKRSVKGAAFKERRREEFRWRRELLPDHIESKDIMRAVITVMAEEIRRARNY